MPVFMAHTRKKTKGFTLVVAASAHIRSKTAALPRTRPSTWDRRRRSKCGDRRVAPSRPYLVRVLPGCLGVPSLRPHHSRLLPRPARKPPPHDPHTERRRNMCPLGCGRSVPPPPSHLHGLCQQLRGRIRARAGIAKRHYPNPPILRQAPVPALPVHPIAVPPKCWPRRNDARCARGRSRRLHRPISGVALPSGVRLSRGGFSQPHTSKRQPRQTDGM
jgi:hypothetical protein